jgi:hypothetical protein
MVDCHLFSYKGLESTGKSGKSTGKSGKASCTHQDACGSKSAKSDGSGHQIQGKPEDYSRLLSYLQDMGLKPVEGNGFYMGGRPVTEDGASGSAVSSNYMEGGNSGKSGEEGKCLSTCSACMR